MSWWWRKWKHKRRITRKLIWKKGARIIHADTHHEFHEPHHEYRFFYGDLELHRGFGHITDRGLVIAVKILRKDLLEVDRRIEKGDLSLVLLDESLNVRNYAAVRAKENDT